MAILCLGNRSLRIDGYWFIRNWPSDGSVRPGTGVLPWRAACEAWGFAT
jgi:hypothetical protein